MAMSVSHAGTRTAIKTYCLSCFHKARGTLMSPAQMGNLHHLCLALQFCTIYHNHASVLSRGDVEMFQTRS